MRLAVWKPDKDSVQCDQCATAFDFFRRRHHCRLCGGIFCRSCSNWFLSEKLLLRWQDAQKKKRVTNALQQVLQIKEKVAPVAHQQQFVSSETRNTIWSTFKTTLRVCKHCYMNVGTFPEVNSVTLHKNTCGPEPFHQMRLEKCSGKWMNNSDVTPSSNTHFSPFRGRERRVYVISLHGSGFVKSAEHMSLVDVFDTLEHLSCQAVLSPTNSNTSSKDITPSLGPSLSSISDLSGMEKSVTGGSLGSNVASVKKKNRRKCRTSTNVPMQNRKKITLHIPISEFSSETGSINGVHNSPANMVVSTQLVGLTQRHGFDKALLQQHTIGTDAYVILVDGDSDSNSEYVGGAGSFVPHETHYPWTAASPCAPSFDASQDSRIIPSVMAEPTISLTHDHLSFGRKWETVRNLLEAIGLYGGAAPICAIVERMSSNRMNNAGVDACVTPMGTAKKSNNSYNNYNDNQQSNGTFYLQCPMDGHQGQTSAEVQAAVLHQALVLVVGDVIRREIVQREKW